MTSQHPVPPKPPLHVAIIMDGNGRWAQQRGLPRLAGHRKGVEAVRRTVEAAAELGIQVLTLYSFSTENWKRPADEVQGLMGLLRRYLRSETAELHAKGVRIRMIGDRSALDDDIVELIDHAEALTAENSRLVLQLALNYGGRQDLVQAALRLARAVRDDGLDPAMIDQTMLSANLSTAGMPDPDLLIRTSGEQRISNFLLWELAYCEMVFLDVFWPDFGREHLASALHDFAQRDRRYGATTRGGV